MSDRDGELGPSARNSERGPSGPAPEAPGAGGMTALTVVGATLGGVTVGVRCVDGVITALGPEVVADARRRPPRRRRGVLLPGLVNGHTHAAMTLFRGYGDDLPLMQWLQEKIWPAEAQADLRRRVLGRPARRGRDAPQRHRAFWDMYWHGDAVAAAVVDGGIRATVCSVP